MQLTRKQSLVLSLGLVALFFIGSVLLLASRKPKAVPVQKTTQTAAQGTELMLGMFYRSQTDNNGKMIWEIKSPKGTFSVAAQKAKLKAPQIWYYKDDGKIITLTAKKALIFFDKTKLVRAELTGNVTVKMDGVTITTPKAVFNNQKQIVTSPKNVKIEKDGAFISGHKLVARIEEQSFSLKKNVVTKITNELKKTKEEHEK